MKGPTEVENNLFINSSKEQGARIGDADQNLTMDLGMYLDLPPMTNPSLNSGGELYEVSIGQAVVEVGLNDSSSRGDHGRVVRKLMETS
ncbi:hypothetical protein VNO78_16129 [Psophocarpus tetragonolobus]|uniref:Uncharacterized protein n=1 Tax=Psophocarpus tetragonolobus TaxID=3891 RepID=A0AAN9SLQ8_PSOTE